MKPQINEETKQNLEEENITFHQCLQIKKGGNVVGFIPMEVFQQFKFQEATEKAFNEIFLEKFNLLPEEVQELKNNKFKEWQEEAKKKDLIGDTE